MNVIGRVVGLVSVFDDEEELAETLIHELKHIEQVQRPVCRDYPSAGACYDDHQDEFEREARQAERTEKRDK